jgi:hypothetical protein
MNENESLGDKLKSRVSVICFLFKYVREMTSSSSNKLIPDTTTKVNANKYRKNATICLNIALVRRFSMLMRN